ncbi:MAG: DUF2085 domain-containing protein [Anaerolineaceae bacterium]|jgi:uncharacterized membrane protein|nr:DUF2085 domain-containing protein [Anaerolineaceae bacterium]
MADQAVIERTTISAQRTTKALRAVLWGLDHWIIILSVGMGVLVIAPFLAPVFMHVGWTVPAQVIYGIYSTLCHQMAQRSYFLFGSQPMYNMAQLPLPLTGKMLSDTLLLRGFIGNDNLGWKVAWSDRMVYMYGGVWIVGMVYGLLRQRRRIRPLNIIVLGLLLLPMLVDGLTHMLSDLSGGLASGFRYNNPWLAELTANRLPSWFYVGDAFGSFNSWMRLISGIMFAVGIVWFAYPYINETLAESTEKLRWKLLNARERGLNI